MADVSFNDAAILKALEQAFKEANEKMIGDFVQEMTDPKWQWPTNPSPRDIIDNGTLKGSHQATPGQHEYLHEWGGEAGGYSLAVHEGARFSDGRTMPARRWTVLPLKKFEKNFGVIAQREIGKLR